MINKTLLSWSPNAYILNPSDFMYMKIYLASYVKQYEKNDRNRKSGKIAHVIAFFLLYYLSNV
jgi:hypothetical protein